MDALTKSRPVRFSDFELDAAAGELYRRGEKLKVQEQPLQVLQFLLEQPGKVITREELQRRIWPSDTFVDFDHGINNAIKRLREALGDAAETPRYIETLPRRGYRFIGKIEVPSKSTGGGIRSLAVLPLENLSHDPEQEYFAEGLTEALITALAKIGELRVVSRTSVLIYKGARKSLPEIAGELQVDGIVEGTVLRLGDRVRISAQLIEAQSDQHVWAESYDRDLRDVLLLHSEVARAIAQEIQIKLTPQEEAQFAHSRIVVPEAYEAHLKGRYHWNRRSGDGLPKAAACFQEAISRDPMFAAAYAGLADSLSGLGIFGFIPPHASFAKAKGLAQHAIELDPSLSEAHTSMAWVSLWYDFDFPAAEREFERAIELNPRYPTAHGWFGYYLGLMGRYEEAYTECQRAIRLEPQSSAIQYHLGCVYWMSRRYDEAIEHFQRALEFDPTFSWSHGFLGFSYQAKSLHNQALIALEKAVETSPGSTLSLLALAEAYALAGRQVGANKILQQVNELAKQRYVLPYFQARVAAALGQKDIALDWLEASYRERTSHLAFLKVDFHFDNLRAEPRFRELMRRMNFPRSIESQVSTAAILSS